MKNLANSSECHVEPRTKLFKADSVDAPIEHIRLTADRDTWVQYDEENGEMMHSVDWTLITSPKEMMD